MDFLIEHDPLDHAHLVTASGELDVPAAPQRGVGGRALGGGGGPPRRGGRAAPPDTSAPRTAAAPRPGALAPMTATLLQPTSAPAHAPPRRRLRERIARAERPLLHGGLALVTVHLLDLALSGSDPTALGLWAIGALPLAWALGRSRLIRPTRLVVGVVTGLLTLGFGV